MIASYPQGDIMAPEWRNLNPLHLELVGVGVSGIVAGGFRGGGG